MDPHSLDKLEFEAVKSVLARHARCELGRKLIGHLQPANREKLVHLWLEETDQMVQALALSGPPPLGGASDVAGLVQRIQPGSGLSGEEFYLVGQTLRATHYVQAYLANLPAELVHLHQLGERIGDFQALAWRIDEVVEASGRVKDTASEKLLKIRTAIEDHRRRVRKVFDRLVRTPSVVKVLQYPNWTFQGDRMVLPVSANYRQQIPGIVHRSSDSGATLFIEPSEAVELNNAIIQFGQEEQQEVSRIFWELSRLIHLNRDEILVAIRALARLDMLTAKAAYAVKRRCVRPEISRDGLVRLWQARHPLLVELFDQEGKGREVVPIDVRLGDDFDMLVITGPNTGGKTVALKTVGLMVLMAQAGMFIPAGPGSVLPVFDNVFIDVGDEQSLQQSLSTFSSHLTRILHILRCATPSSLVLIDELGAGTDPDEGAAIGQAILDELLGRKTRAMVSTHLSPLKSYAYRRPRADNAAVEFDPQTLRATYRLHIGEPGNSNALIIAEHLGASKRLLERARGYVSQRVKAFQQAIDAAVGSRREAEQARRLAQAAEHQARQREQELQSRIEQVDREREAYRRWLEWVNSLKAGQRVFIRNMRREGTVVRMELHKQQALVNVGRLAAEVPIKELAEPASVEEAKG